MRRKEPTRLIGTNDGKIIKLYKLMKFVFKIRFYPLNPFNLPIYRDKLRSYIFSFNTTFLFLYN